MTTALSAFLRLSFFCFCALNLFGLPVSAQHNTINVKKTRKVIATTPDGKDILYKGAVNPVYFILVNDTSANLSIKPSKNIKVSGKNRRLQVTVDSGATAFFLVSQVLPGGKVRFVDTVKMGITRIPAPVTSVAGRTGTDTISKSVLQRADSLELLMMGFKCDCVFKVKSFSMSAMRGGAMYTMNANGGNFTGQIKKLIAELKTGEKVFFEDVTVYMPDGSQARVPGVSFRIN